MKRLRLLGKVRGRYEESVGAMEVIGRKKKSLVATEVTGWLLCKYTGCYAKPAVAMERLRLLWKVSRRLVKSVVAVVSH
jgi:hypothetical protein